MNQERVAQANKTPQTTAPIASSILHRNKANQSKQSDVPPVAHKMLRSPEQRLDAENRDVLGHRFGHDFSRVKTHATRGRAGGNGRFHFRLASRDQSEESSAVPKIVHDVLRDPGHPLDPDVRTYMESRFNTDFSYVRIHTNTKASESALASNALAYTVNQDIVFGSGQYAPKTRTGKKLLAHELTHVVQQRRINPSTATTPRLISNAGNSAEREAYTTANRVVVGNSPVEVTQGGGTQMLWPWRGSFDITTRLPKSQEFSVSSGTVIVESSARWKSSGAGAAACPESSNYKIGLWEKVDWWFDTNHGYKTYPVPGTATHTWASLPSGTYYLEIYYPNTNPYCRILGDLNVTT